MQLKPVLRALYYARNRAVAPLFEALLFAVPLETRRNT